MSDRRKKTPPVPMADVLSRYLEGKGLAGRVEQAGIIPEWEELVGTRIAAVTEPKTIAANGTLFVTVTTNAWMNELSLLEPELLRLLNARTGRIPVRKIRWLLRRPGLAEDAKRPARRQGTSEDK